MGKLPLALCLTLFLLFPSADSGGVSLIQQAAAQASDALIQKCRKAVFRKYGRREVKGERRVRVMPTHLASGLIDQCVANGGRVS